MKNNKDVTVILEDDAKERIANAELSAFIDLLAELIAKESIRKITESKNGEVAGGPTGE